MTRRRSGRLAAVLAAVAITVGLSSLPASAEAAATQGWWTVTNPGADGSGAPVSVAPSPPDVPSDGMLIQGGQSDSSPSALAAVLYQLPAGATAGRLTLAVAGNSGTTPGATLQVCPLSKPVIAPEQGGPMAHAPAYDCTRHATATVSDSGAFEFTVGSLAQSGTLAVAIVPGTVTDRVVLAKPGADSLSVQQASAGAAATSPPAAQGASPTPASAPAAAPTTAAPASRTVAVTATETGAAPVPTPPAVADPGPAPVPASGAGVDTVAAPDAAAGAAVAATPAATGLIPRGPGPAKPLAVALAVTGVMLAGMLWLVAGRAAVDR